MDLWTKLRGTFSAELTAADPMALLARAAEQGAELWDIRPVSDLTVRFRAGSGEREMLYRLAQKQGAELKVLGLEGLALRASGVLKRPVLLGTLLFLAAASMILPGRILFLDVVGCEQVPERLILEQAAQRGLSFGASRKLVRSEAIKNELLSVIPELEWVGVNTAGSTAVICVRERSIRQPEESPDACDIVSVCDAIVEEITVTGGTLLCRVGDAVRAGDVLVSGFEDLGFVTRAVPADAEIYGISREQIRAKLPGKTLLREPNGEKWRKYTLILGKKQIFLYSDGGILPPTCGKMRKTIPLRLPGGLCLPVWLVIEEGQGAALTPADRAGMEELLTSFAREYLRGKMVAGTILTERISCPDGETAQLSFGCRRMIAARRSGVILEGDTEDDPENSQRGAG